MKRQTLWTYDFTVITIGSFISLVGSTLSGYALSLVVLDYTGSTFLYMLFNVSYQLPMLICPVLAGPYLDRVSRKRVIYTLDFLSAGIYLILFLLLQNDWFSYPVLLTVSILTGTINSVYMVAYDSLYPNLITEGNFEKAYSILSLTEQVAFMTAPVAAALYNWLGSAAPLFAIDAVSFFVAACFEVTIRHKETHMQDAPAQSGLSAVGQFRRELREGLDYMRGEKGLLLIALYFMASSIAGGAEQLRLPYFLNHADRFAVWPVAAATLYAILSNFAVAGRLVGGGIQYRLRIPKERRFDTAFVVYVTINVLSGTLLFLPVPLMAVWFFLDGVLGVTSYNIRASATQSYIPDSKRARFNGTFQMLTAVGGVVGSLVIGALAEILPERQILLGANALVLATVYLFIWRGREHVKKVYNREV